MGTEVKHWMHKNDKEWTEEEITNLIISETGKDVARPVGYNLLVKMYKKSEKIGNTGLYRAPQSQEVDKFFEPWGRVLAMGKYAYYKDNFPLGKFCNIGDYIVFRQYQSQDLPIKEINDGALIEIPCDKVTTVVKDLSELIL